MSEEFVKKLKARQTRDQQVWMTPGGSITTNKKVKAQFTIPELHNKRLIEWDVHITKTLGAYDMIIGRDLLQFLGIDVLFSNLTVKWEGSSMPFKISLPPQRGLIQSISCHDSFGSNCWAVQACSDDMSSTSLA